MDQREGKAGLEFHDDGRVTRADPDHIGRANLALDRVALPFKEGFDGRVEGGFGERFL
jgi:hypothetical protein